VVDDNDLSFLKKVSPEFGGKKYLIPPPLDCPDCRLRQRLAWRNLRNLYRTKSDKSGVDIVSNYAPDGKVKVYTTKEYYEDDATSYGRDFDFSRSFFPQFQELYFEVPKANLTNDDSCENADFFNGGRGVKNAYMSFGAVLSEDIYYCEGIRNSAKCYDCYRVNHGEICYECVYSSRLYNCYYCLKCSDCRGCYFSIDANGCHDCFGCVGLKNKQYYIYNQPQTKEEYEQFMAEFKFLPSRINEERQKLHELYLSVPQKAVDFVDAEDCSGEYIVHSKNVHDSYDIVGGENVRYGFALVDGVKDCMDITYFGINLERCYMCQSIATDCSNILFCSYVYNVAHNILYSIDIWKGWNSSDLFGCVGLGKKQYCILNKQYSKEEYFKLVPKIIGHMQQAGEWGQFFPYDLSPFGYNETEAMDYFPIKREEAIKLGAGWRDEDYGIKYDGPFYQPKEINFYDPKQNLNAQKEIDEALAGILQCEVSGKPFRLISQELVFYIEHGLPIPTKHPMVRFQERFKQRRGRILYDRKCGKCGTDIKTTFGPEAKNIVYCEKCYANDI